MRRPNRRPNYMELEDIVNYETVSDYLVFIDGTSYVAINGDTGAELSRGPDAATVINLALAKTGCIFIKTGTYPIKSQLDIPSNTSLHGCGKTTILQRHADLGAVALIENADTGAGNDNIEICNLTIDGNDAGHAVASFGIRLVIVTRALVKDLYIYDTGLDGIHLRTCSHCEIRGINLNNTGNHAIFVGYTSSYCLVSDIISVDPKTEHVCIEWQAVADDNIYITVSDVTGSGAENQGIYIQHAQHILISNCSVYDTFNSGFTLRDCDDVLVNNCISDTTTTNDKACFETVITATNVIFNCCAAYNAESGEASGFVLYGTRITLANSIASGCKRGVETHVTSSDYIDVHNCIFEDYSWGILVTGDFIKYHDNIFSNPDGAVSYCFYVEPSTNIEIYNNDVRAACTGAEIRNYDAADRVEDNAGWVTENSGVSGVIADAATINHGLAVAPTHVVITGTVAGEIVNVTAIGAANFTVAIKSNAGAAGTNQAIYWIARE